MFRKMLWMLCLLLAGCGASKQAGDKDAPMAAKDTVFGDDIKALDKARQVQDTLMQDKAKTDAAIESATSSSATE